jgi:hypothetical protein
MRGGSNLKNFIIAGLIAGISSGIVFTIFNISGLWDLFSVLPFIWPVDTQTFALINITLSSIWGIIWGAFFAFFYDYVPSKGVKKGLVYGLIIWIIAPIHDAGTSAMYGWYLYSIPYALASFFSTGITYGLVLGYFYKK